MRLYCSKMDDIMGMSFLPTLFVVTVLALLYFVPAIVAHQRNHPNFGAITATNVLLGWTALGWIVALIWSLTAVKTTVVTETVTAE